MNTVTLNIVCDCKHESTVDLEFPPSPIGFSELPSAEWTCPACGVIVRFRLSLDAKLIFHPRNKSQLVSVKLT